MPPIRVVVASQEESQITRLGAFYDNSYKGDGLRIVELLQGGPLSFGGSKIEKGMIIERIDGEPIKADQPT